MRIRPIGAGHSIRSTPFSDASFGSWTVRVDRPASAPRALKNPLRRADRATQGVPQGEANSRVSHRHRTVDTLSRMLEATTISPEMYEAGRSFQTAFAVAALDPIRARPLVLPVGEAASCELTDRQLHARRRVHQALDALGGISSPAGSCIWHVVGLQRSVREWAMRQGWGGRPVRQEQAQGILVAALGVLAAHFGYGESRLAS